MITRFGERLGALTLPVSAFVGGICSAVAVMLLFHFKKQRGAEHLVICGLAISFFIRRADQLSDFLGRPAGRQLGAVLVAGWARSGALG